MNYCTLKHSSLIIYFIVILLIPAACFGKGSVLPDQDYQDWDSDEPIAIEDGRANPDAASTEKDDYQYEESLNEENPAEEIEYPSKDLGDEKEGDYEESIDLY